LIRIAPGVSRASTAGPTICFVSGDNARCSDNTSLAVAEPHRRALFRGQRVVASLEAPAPQDHRHVEGAGPANHLAGDGAGAGDAERLPGQSARLGVELLVPGAGTQIGDVVGDAAIDGEQQREGQLGDGDRILAGAVRDVDAALRGPGHVDRVVARPRANDERQPPGIEHRRRHFGAANNQDVRRAGRDRLRERIFLEIGIVDDIAARSLEPLDTALLELVCY
jgi:hypothetical protein